MCDSSIFPGKWEGGCLQVKVKASGLGKTIWREEKV